MSWTKVCSTTDIPPSQIKEFKTTGPAVAVAHVDNQFYAIAALCTHAHCPLASGTLDHHALTCCCHGAQFDVRTGEVLALPATDPVTTYPLKTKNKNIYIKI